MDAIARQSARGYKVRTCEKFRRAKFLYNFSFRNLKIDNSLSLGTKITLRLTRYLYKFNLCNKNGNILIYRIKERWMGYKFATTKLLSSNCRFKGARSALDFTFAKVSLSLSLSPSRTREISKTFSRLELQHSASLRSPILYAKRTYYGGGNCVQCASRAVALLTASRRGYINPGTSASTSRNLTRAPELIAINGVGEAGKADRADGAF